MTKKHLPFELQGKVGRGDGWGRALGYPTANIQSRKKIPDGVYAGWACVRHVWYPAAAVIGVDGKQEIHILNWQGNLYGKVLRVFMVKRLRDIKKFKFDAALKTQIRKDLAATKKFLS